jgi:EAL domain-containing protein (putative c-di-GMP-specific phosphodiesterase class I)
MPGRKILILDDDPAVGQTIQWIAESLGFEAEFVTRPEEFFRLLDQVSPEFITIDLVMPELDGVEVMRLLAGRKCTSKIIISSGMGTRVLDAAKRSAAEHGLDIVGVISKPISKEALHLLVGEGSVSLPAVPAVAPKADADLLIIEKSSLQAALDRREFELAYQPKIQCKSGAPAGFEALVRWRHPERGIIMPGHFIPIVEEAGLIDELSTQVFEQGLWWFSGAFPRGELKLSLNISAKSLVDLHLVDSLFNLCREYHVAPERIVLELTETSAMTDPILSLDLMTRFRVKGFQLSIDDFGTGFSSMVQLARLPFSEIKVDRSFVMNARQSQESRTIIKSVIDLGHSLGLVVTAEGVEDVETFNYLNDLGCDLAQGYFIARPMPGEAALTWTERTRPAQC